MATIFFTHGGCFKANNTQSGLTTGNEAFRVSKSLEQKQLYVHHITVLGTVWMKPKP